MLASQPSLTAFTKVGGGGLDSATSSFPLSLPRALASGSPEPLFAGVRRCGPGADDLGGLRLPLQVHHAAAEQGRVQPGAQRARASGGLLHRGDRELGVRLPLLLHRAALLPQPLRERVEDG